MVRGIVGSIHVCHPAGPDGRLSLTSLDAQASPVLDREPGDREGLHQGAPLALLDAERLPPAARQAEPWVQQAYLARQRERLEKQLRLHLAHSGPLNAQAGELLMALGWQDCGACHVAAYWVAPKMWVRHTCPAQCPAGQWLLPATLGHLQKQFMPGAAPAWCICWCRGASGAGYKHCCKLLTFVYLLQMQPVISAQICYTKRTDLLWSVQFASKKAGGASYESDLPIAPLCEGSHACAPVAAPVAPSVQRDDHLQQLCRRTCLHC